MINYSSTDFASIVSVAEDTRRFIEDAAGPLDSASALALDFERAKEALAFYEVGKVPPEIDADALVEGMVNVHCLNRIIQRARGSPFESRLRSRLRDLKKGVPGQMNAGPQSAARDRVFELYCAHITTFFALDSDFREPDVTCSFQDATWGLACKCAYGTPDTTADKLRKGVRQIERSGVDFGLVVVGLTNIFPHDRMYERNSETGEVTTLRQVEALSALMVGHLVKVTDPIEYALAASHEMASLKVSTRVRGILYVAHTLAYNKERRTMMGCARFTRANAVVMPGDEAFVTQFNEYWQQI